MTGFARLILIQSLFTLPSVGFGANLSCVTNKSCHLHTDPSVQAQVMACEAVVHSDECKSLGKDVKLRDCDSEALCPNDLDQNYLLGCLAGGGQYVMDIVDIVTTPVKLLQAGISEDLDHARYNNPALNKSCRENEMNVAKASPGEDLDCEGDFAHAA